MLKNQIYDENVKASISSFLLDLKESTIVFKSDIDTAIKK